MPSEVKYKPKQKKKKIREWKKAEKSMLSKLPPVSKSPRPVVDGTSVRISRPKIESRQIVLKLSLLDRSFQEKQNEGSHNFLRLTVPKL